MSETKTRGQVAPSFTINWRSSNGNNGTYNRTRELSRYGQRIVTTKTPDFFSRLKAGDVLPVNPFTNSKWDYAGGGHLSAMRRKSDGSVYDSVSFSGNGAVDAILYNAPSPPPVSVDPAPLRVKALAEARSAGWDIGTLLAEADKTVELVGQASSRTDKRIDDIVSKRKGRPRTYEQFLDAWMEYRYGWRLLAYDIESAEEALAKLHHGLETLVRRSATASESATSNRSSLVSSYSGMRVATQYQIDVSCERTVDIKAGCGYSHRLGSGIGFVDPLVTSYELIPFSFVADWFVNVSDNLSAFSPFGTGDLEFGYTTTTTRDVWTATVKPVPLSAPSGGTSEGSGVLDGTYMHQVTDRAGFSSVSPSLAFKTDVTLPKAMDLLALAVTRKGRLLKKLAGRG